MGKRIVHVYKHRQCNWPYPYPKTTFVVPPRSMLAQQSDSTNDCIATIIACKKPSPVSNLTATDQVDTDVNNNDDTQYFATPIKQNNKTSDIRDTNNKTTPDHPSVHSHLFQRSPSTQTTSVKLCLHGN